MKTLILLILVLIAGLTGIILVASQPGAIDPFKMVFGSICIVFAIVGLIISAKDIDRTTRYNNSTL